jgi:PAS domain S-box-containing protein
LQVKWSIDRNIMAGFGAALAILIIAGTISFQAMRKVTEADRWVAHTHEVLSKIGALLSTAQDVETGMRGYTITGERSFLEPYQTAITVTSRQVGDLRSLTADNPSQQQRLDVLVTLMKERTSIASEIVESRQQGDPIAAQMPRMIRGKNVMDRIRKVISEMEGEEENLLRRRIAESEASARRTALTISILILLTFAFLLFASYAVIHHLTERMRMEEALRSSEERYRSLVANVPDVIWTADAERHTHYISPNVERVYGYAPDEVIRAGAALRFGRVHPDDLERLKQTYKSLFAENRIFDTQYRIQRKDGQWIWLHDRAMTTYQRDGKMYADGVFSDITASREAEEKLQQTEEKFRLLLDSTAEGIYGIDREGNCTFCNPACLQMLSYRAPEELLGNNMHALIHHTRSDGSHYPPADCRIYRAFRQGEGTHADDEVFWRANKTCFPAEYWSYPIRRGEEVIGAVVAFLDITERKRYQDQIEQKQRELELRNRQVEKEHQLAESLLLNILPNQVARELQTQGTVEPKYFEDVTILFADFVGFALATEKLAAEELVHMLNDYFTAFDEITTRYGMEKLKTIGDSYMCAGGLPVRSSSHPVDAVLTAFEMVRAVTERDKPDRPLHLAVRIGIHTGAVVAGVVGIRKFAFDIWGDSVNFASRMESNGAPNRINISGRAYARAKDFFQCEYRGKILTKEKRESDMYFVTGILPSLKDEITQLPPPAFLRRYRNYFQKDPPAFPAFLVEAG